MFHRVVRPLLAAGIAAVAMGATTVSSASAESETGNLYARVSMSGALVAGGGVTNVRHLSAGQYEVTFATNVRRCAYVATTISTSTEAHGVYTAGGHLSPDGVYVETKNQHGGLTDEPFNLVVDCGQPGMSYAVVGYNGLLARSSPDVQLTQPGTGRYDIRFPARVAGCAYLATVGDPGHALVFNPNGVYSGSGPDARTVYVETKNIGGGLSPGIPFHLAVICPTAERTRIAVVAADGIAARGSSLTSSFAQATGQYTVVTNRHLAACATVATRGSTNTAVPFGPATVEIAPGPADNTIGIQVHGLLFFGGHPVNEAFHAAIVC